MSAFVCTNNRTFSCIVELAMKFETITNPDLLAQRLYLLNVESVNQRYGLKDSTSKGDRDEYAAFIARASDVRYEPQPQLEDAQRIVAARCWLYQSCEGDCDQNPLFRAVEAVLARASKKTALRIAAANGWDFDSDNVLEIIDRYIKEAKLESMWE